MYCVSQCLKAALKFRGRPLPRVGGTAAICQRPWRGQPRQATRKGEQADGQSPVLHSPCRRTAAPESPKNPVETQTIQLFAQIHYQMCHSQCFLHLWALKAFEYPWNLSHKQLQWPRDLLLSSYLQHQPGQSSVFNYFFINCFHMLVCSLCHFFHWLLVFDSIWTAKRSFFQALLRNQQAAEGCCALLQPLGLPAAQCSRSFSSPFPAWGCLSLCVCVCVWFGFFSF